MIVEIKPTDFEKIDREVRFAQKKISEGLPKERIIRKIRRTILSKEDVFEIAKSRIKSREKFGNLSEKLFFDESGLRYSTPPVVSEYRAERLKSRAIADISCGVGAQLIFFAKKGRAMGVELDRKRAILAKLNLIAMGVDGLVVAGDALSDEVISIVKSFEAEVIFSDPARPPSMDVRTFDGLEPMPEMVLKRYEHITDKIAFELPPQMPPERIKLDGEKEYTSLDFRLNRLAFYRGELAECDVSAVTLPSMERVTDQDDRLAVDECDEVESMIHEVDYTIVKAGLLENLLGKYSFEAKLWLNDGRRVLLTSDRKSETEFMRDYEVIDTCRFSASEVNRRLKVLNAGKVTIRFAIDPKNYWSVRKKLEEGLAGEEWYHLFRKDSEAVIAKGLRKETIKEGKD
ncbi:hypothetical protein Asulf_00532 [Archaeoglobus sulfaticallidus PM70-1]|uniref:THUMP-like domain-containing protein n=1 Tax=Archaeoglobus sulfaticallidus PM70-1 TaxID=387631 RepID=N0BC46_9EURY|nr:SAM-dependent methyltransferase [Archaeoglobus sulfaticallidus]AGK60553.1 hypothetical protein Asulf_00532 [Archaeoglobus sulfaticallidus PM70-1]